MKKMILSTFCIASLTALLLTGCSSSNTEKEVYPQVSETNTQIAAAADEVSSGDNGAANDASSDNNTAANDTSSADNASTGGASSNSNTAANDAGQNKSQGKDQGDIGEDKAKEIALADASLKESEVSGMRISLDVDHDGKDPTVYDVEFYSGNTEYDYEIDAANGEIRSKDADAEHIDRSSAATSASDVISETEAKEIALDHAGLKESEVQALRVKLDKDDGIYEYEVEFYVDKLEYSYELNAANGTIISYEQDYD